MVDKTKVHGRVSNGEEIELDISRRDAMRYLGGAATATSGLSALITNAAGKEPDGVPLVHVVDKEGNPSKVRIVPEERHRALEAIENYPTRKIIENNPNIQAITIEHGSAETDIFLKFVVETHDKAAERALPNKIGDVPVTLEEGKVELKSRSARKCEYSDTIRGGLAIQRAGKSGYGTAGLTAYDESDPDKRVLVTAEHVLEGDDAVGDAVWHPYAQGCSKARRIGASDVRLNDNDVGRVNLVDGEVMAWEIGETVDVLNDIEYCWTWRGVADYTDENTIPAEYAGASTEHFTDKAVGTTVNGMVDDGVIYKEKSDPSPLGDSGGPIMERDTSRMISHISGEHGRFSGVNETWQTYGCAAANALDAADAALHK